MVKRTGPAATEQLPPPLRSPPRSYLVSQVLARVLLQRLVLAPKHLQTVVRHAHRPLVDLPQRRESPPVAGVKIVFAVLGEVDVGTPQRRGRDGHADVVQGPLEGRLDRLVVDVDAAFGHLTRPRGGGGGTRREVGQAGFTVNKSLPGRCTSYLRTVYLGTQRGDVRQPQFHVAALHQALVVHLRATADKVAKEREKKRVRKRGTAWGKSVSVPTSSAAA